MIKRFAALASAGLLVSVAALVYTSGLAGAATKPPTNAKGKVLQVEKADTSPQLKSLKGKNDPVEVAPAGKVKEMPLRGRVQQEVAPAQASPAPRAAESAGPEGPLSPPPVRNFEGLEFTDPVFPPDPNGAAGPNHYVQIVNLTFAVYDKNGTELFRAKNNTLWAGFGGLCQTNNNGDPVVEFDRYANRWVISQFAFNTPLTGAWGPFHQFVAVSTTADPLGTYSRYDFLVSQNLLNDYPKIGVWPDGYYLTFNQYRDCAGTGASCRWAGGGVVVMERDRMVLGRPNARAVYFNMQDYNVEWGNFLPADVDGPILPPSGSPGYVASLANRILPNGADTAPLPRLQIFSVHVDWQFPFNSTFNLTRELNTPNFNPFFNPAGCFSPDPNGLPQICIPQPGTTSRLEGITDRLMYRLQYRNFGDHEALVSNHAINVGDPNGENVATTRWFELRQQPGVQWSIYQLGTLPAADGISRWMGSAAMDEHENIALGYSVSNSTNVFPGIRYNSRRQTDPINTMPQGETVLVNGGGVQLDPRGRWGDYSAMQLDPTDDCTFWYTNQYQRATATVHWYTRVGAFNFPDCGARSTA